MSEAFQSLGSLQTEARFTDGTFNAETLLKCYHDRFIAAVQLLFKIISPLIDVRDPSDNSTLLIGTTDKNITAPVTMDQVLTLTNDFTQSELTV